MRVLAVVVLAAACGGATKMSASTSSQSAAANPPIQQTPPPPPPEEPAKPADEAAKQDQVAAMDPDDGGEITEGMEGIPRTGAGEGGGGTGTGSLGTIGSGAGAPGLGYGGVRVTNPQPQINMRIGTATIQGKLAPEIVKRVIRRYQQQLRYCYEVHLRSNPKARGLVVVKYAINPEGAVSTASASGIHADVEACLANRFRVFAYPRPTDGKAVMVTQPLTFSPP